jgi:hypothetical protein
MAFPLIPLNTLEREIAHIRGSEKKHGKLEPESRRWQWSAPTQARKARGIVPPVKPRIENIHTLDRTQRFRYRDSRDGAVG